MESLPYDFFVLMTFRRSRIDLKSVKIYAFYTVYLSGKKLIIGGKCGSHLNWFAQT